MKNDDDNNYYCFVFLFSLFFLYSYLHSSCKLSSFSTSSPPSHLLISSFSLSSELLFQMIMVRLGRVLPQWNFIRFISHDFHTKAKCLVKWLKCDRSEGGGGGERWSECCEGHLRGQQMSVLPPAETVPGFWQFHSPISNLIRSDSKLPLTLLFVSPPSTPSPPQPPTPLSPSEVVYYYKLSKGSEHQPTPSRKVSIRIC